MQIQKYIANISSNSRYFITQPIRIEYFKHMTELIHSRPISVQDFMGVSTTCKTITKSLPTFPRHVRHTKSHVSTNFILTSYLALQSGRVWPPIDVTLISFSSRPFRFKKFKKSLKKWPGKRWFGGHLRYWLDSSCLVGAESDQSGGLGSQGRILSRTKFFYLQI